VESNVIHVSTGTAAGTLQPDGKGNWKGGKKGFQAAGTAVIVSNSFASMELKGGMGSEGKGSQMEGGKGGKMGIVPSGKGGPDGGKATAADAGGAGAGGAGGAGAGGVGVPKGPTAAGRKAALKPTYPTSPKSPVVEEPEDSGGPGEGKITSKISYFNQGKF
jgi:hypothetical protein